MEDMIVYKLPEKCKYTSISHTNFCTFRIHNFFFSEITTPAGICLAYEAPLRLTKRY